MLPHPVPAGPTPPGPTAEPVRTWFDAWTDAAYGPGGFWTRERPADHFRTGAATGTSLARAVARLAEQAGTTTVVDVGAGDGDLLTGLAALPGAAVDLTLVGVDRRARPVTLHPRVGWHVDHHDVRTGRWDSGPDAWLDGAPGPALLVAHEWLDDLPARVVRRDGSGWVEATVGAAGAEGFGSALTADDATWAECWWSYGRRAELGRTRDVAWAQLVRTALATGGLALAVDYGHVRAERPTDGTLAAYARGRTGPPRPDPALNLTAHVAVDALLAAGESVGATTRVLGRQRDLLPRLLDEPEPSGPGRSTLEDLVRRSEDAALRSEAVWGRLWWLLQGVAPAEARTSVG